MTERERAILSMSDPELLMFHQFGGRCPVSMEPRLFKMLGQVEWENHPPARRLLPPKPQPAPDLSQALRAKGEAHEETQTASAPEDGSMIHRFTTLRTVDHVMPAGTCFDKQTAQPGRPSVECQIRKYEAIGARENQPRRPTRADMPRPLTAEEVREINRLRPTHTLKQLGAMFDRHPSTIDHYCRERISHRGKRGRRTQRAEAA